MQINENCYFVVHSWMTNELGLRTAERDVFAVIYGFSQDGSSDFHGSLSYLSNITGYSRNSVCSALKSLAEKGFIKKEEQTVNNIKYCSYTSSLDGIQVACMGIQGTCMNNKEIKKENKSISKEILQPEPSFKLSSKKPIVKKPNLFTKCSDLIDSYTKNPALHESLVNYLRVRLEMKDKPLYFNSWKGLLNKLDREFAEDEKVAVVNQSIERGYASFFPLMKGGAGSKLKESGSRHVKSFTEEDYERETEFHEECSKKGLPTQF